MLSSYGPLSDSGFIRSDDKFACASIEHAVEMIPDAQK